MKKLVALGVVALLVVGIAVTVGGRGSRGSEARARSACENVASRCEHLTRLRGGKIDPAGVDECSSDLAKELQRGDAYDRLTDCMIEATSCGEVMGCGAGAFAKEREGFGKGFDRMTKQH